MEHIKLITAVIFSSYIFGVSAAEPSEDAISHLQTQWAIDNYQLSGKEQKEAFIALIREADNQVGAHPNEASVYIWRAIIKSSYAGVKRDLGGLKYVKAAKQDLEKALSLDANALKGSAYTSLGSLYFNVPGWPISFGDDEKAEELLTKAIEINPEGIDANYFYGSFLLNEKRYPESLLYLQKALTAEPRIGRELADKGRREEINTLLLEVEKALK